MTQMPVATMQFSSCSFSVFESYKFTGKERDGESMLDYFGVRHLSSALGRFMQPDEPFADQSEGDPQSWNLYSYVRNNPLSNIDPDGHGCAGSLTGGAANEDWGIGGATCEEERRIQEGKREKKNDPCNGNTDYCTTVTAALPDELNPYALAVFSQPSLQTAAATMTDPRTYALWFGASATLGYGLYAAGAFEGGLTTLELGAEAGGQVTPTVGQTAQVSRQLAQQGRKSLEKSLRTLERRLAEHEAKLGQIREAGGHASSVEREIQNFKGLIQAIKTVLGQ